MRGTIAAIDIGTSKVSVLVGVPDGRGVRVIASGVVPSRGMDRGIVSHIGDATEALADAVSTAEKGLGGRIESAYLAIGGPHVLSHNLRGEAPVQHPLRGVEAEDVAKALSEARNLSLPPERRLLHIVPRGYWLDGNVQVRDPVGMAAYRLEAEVHVITALASSVQNASRCVDSLGISVDGLILSGLAAGESVLTEQERDLGVAMVDIGGGTTDIAVYLNGGVWHTAVLPVGGQHVTNDLVAGLHCPLPVAEDVKLRFGHCRLQDLGIGENLRVPGYEQDGSVDVSRRDVVNIVSARMEEIFTLILKELRRSSYDGLLAAGVVICGGAAGLPGMEGLGTEVLGMPVRLLAPQRASGLVEVTSDPAQAVACGLLMWGLRQADSRSDVQSGVLGRVGKVVRGMLPGRGSSR